MFTYFDKLVDFQLFNDQFLQLFNDRFLQLFNDQFFQLFNDQFFQLLNSYKFICYILVSVHLFYKYFLTHVLRVLFTITYFLIKFTNINKLFHYFMVKFDRYRVINDRQDAEPYLLRYYVFIKDRSYFPFNVFLHKFLKSDPDDVHDHPWPFITIILYGGYWEYKPESTDNNGKILKLSCKWWGAGSIRYAPSTQLHRIELDPDVKNTWTLFIPGPKQRDWGFKTDKGWIHNESYLSDKKKY